MLSRKPWSRMTYHILSINVKRYTYNACSTYAENVYARTRLRFYIIRVYVVRPEWARIRARAGCTTYKRISCTARQARIRARAGCTTCKRISGTAQQARIRARAGCTTLRSPVGPYTGPCGPYNV